jgi:hypothetical protein
VTDEDVGDVERELRLVWYGRLLQRLLADRQELTARRQAELHAACNGGCGCGCEQAGGCHG